MEPDYYKISCHLEDRNVYLIWYTADQDRLLVDEQGLVISFSNIEDLFSYVSKHRILIHDGMMTYDLDAIARWVDQPGAATVDCVSFFDAWNLFSDVAASVGELGETFTDLEEKYFGIYDELFHGNNLPGFTLPGEEYTPQWSVSDIQEMHQIFKAGLDLFHHHVR